MLLEFYGVGGVWGRKASPTLTEEGQRARVFREGHQEQGVCGGGGLVPGALLV